MSKGEEEEEEEHLGCHMAQSPELSLAASGHEKGRQMKARCDGRQRDQGGGWQRGHSLLVSTVRAT